MKIVVVFIKIKGDKDVKNPEIGARKNCIKVYNYVA